MRWGASWSRSGRTTAPTTPTACSCRSATPSTRRVDRSSSGTDVVGTYAAVSDDGASFTPSGMVSSVTHQPSYEMFGNRSIPFQGDYNWVALAFDGTSSLFGYMGWTDNRDVRPGVDIRETDYVDGFDVFQCRTPTALEPDQCPNAHGLDQNIYGQSITLPVG